MFKRGRKSHAEEDAYRNFSIAEQRLMEDAPIAVLWYEEFNSLMDSKIQNLHQNNIMYFDFSKVYLKREKPKAAN